MEELQQPKAVTANVGKTAADEFAEVHSKALDDLVTVNSLFTIAVFIGLSYANPNAHSLEEYPECDPKPAIAKRLIFYEVLSFSFFLTSSLAAKSLKVLLAFYKIDNKLEFSAPSLHVFLSRGWRYSLLFLSFAASVGGIVTLTLSMVHLIQIRLGRMSCGSAYTERSIIILTAMVGTSLLILYLPPFLMGMCTSIATKGQQQQQ